MKPIIENKGEKIKFRKEKIKVEKRERKHLHRRRSIENDTITV